MCKPFRFFCNLLAGIALMILLYCTLQFLLTLNISYEPFGPTHLNQSSGPLTLAEARKQYPFEYPSTAKSIQFASYSHGVALELTLRFEASIEDCIACAKKTLSNGEQSAELNPINHVNASEVLISSVVNNLWFTPQDIKQGFEGGTHGSRKVKIWIDAENGIFYMQCHD